MNEMKKSLRDLELGELTEILLEAGEQAFRAKQLYAWLHRKLAGSYAEMTNLGTALREKLGRSYSVALPEPVAVPESKLDGTKKFIFRLEDGHVIESVWMKYRHGNSVCISSQVGCRMGCRFCASTLDGLARSLSSGEMLAQIYQIQRLTRERVSNIVVMGSGEPLDNYPELTRFLRMISDENGLHISQRNITVSTCGLPSEIRQLASEGYAITLALSLHAPNDTVRQTLMPIAKRYSLREVLPAMEYYFEKTGRRVTFEYSVVQGVNDTEDEARELARLLGNWKRGGSCQCHVNLIPVNPIRERGWKRPERRSVEAFRQLLCRNGINATIRREMGSDISGACGQLRRDYLREETAER